MNENSTNERQTAIDAVIAIFKKEVPDEWATYVAAQKALHAANTIGLARDINNAEAALKDVFEKLGTDDSQVGRSEFVTRLALEAFHPSHHAATQALRHAAADMYAKAALQLKTAAPQTFEAYMALPKVSGTSTQNRKDEK
ncbi:MAG: hypothetical protein OXT69_12155 [Candidatus Poribacteria bacterium]|nr:hypothetical protein [Candidatus Poribacteria bacterium]